METASAAAVAAHVQRATNELVAAAALVPHCGQEDEAALSKVVGALGQAEAAAQVGLLKEGMRAAPKHSRTPWRRAAAPVPPPPPPPACRLCTAPCAACSRSRPAAGCARWPRCKWV